MSTTTPTTKNAETPSARFTNMMLREYQATTGTTEASPALRRRMQNFYIKIDMILQDAETKRLSKSEQYRDELSFEWKNVNMTKLALDCMVHAALELDALTPNHVTPIPYKNNRTKKYDFTFMKGYRGLEVIAKKFGLDAPTNVVAELVYSTDSFEIIKKDRSNPVEYYSYKINNPFSNRGEIVGGFFYLQYENETLNRVEIMTVEEIEKRKPKYASAEFWGGEKTDFKTKKTEIIDGWKKEMYLKTLLRKAYNSVTIDGSKIDGLYEKMIVSDNTTANEIEIEETTEDTTAVVVEAKQIEEQPVNQEIVDFMVTTHEVVSVPASIQAPEEAVVFDFPTME